MAEVKTGIEGEMYIYSGTINWSTATASGSRFGFVEGVTVSWDQDQVPIWDRGTFSHWKKGRGAGEVSISQAYVDDLGMITYANSTTSGSTAPVLQAEIRCFGSAAALEHTIQLSDIALKNFERNEPEGAEKVTWSLGFDLMKIPVRATSSRISG
jgi:hypothetical protein